MEDKITLVDFRIKKIYEVEVILELDDEVELREVYSKDFPKQFVNYINESDEEQGRGDEGDNWFVHHQLPTYEKSYCHELGVPVWEDDLDDFFDTSLDEKDYEEHIQTETVFRVSRNETGDGLTIERKVEDEKQK